LAKDFDCSFSEVAAADQVTEVSSFNCFYYIRIMFCPVLFILYLKVHKREDFLEKLLLSIIKGSYMILTKENLSSLLAQSKILFTKP
jgi:hypothetical protein